MFSSILDSSGFVNLTGGLHVYSIALNEGRSVLSDSRYLKITHGMELGARSKLSNATSLLHQSKFFIDSLNWPIGGSNGF